MMKTSNKAGGDPPMAKPKKSLPMFPGSTVGAPPIEPMETRFAKAVEKSGNEKTGRVAATYAPFETCPHTCAFHPDKKGGCYASGGNFNFPSVTGNIEKAVDRMRPDLSEIARQEANEIDNIFQRDAHGIPLRIHVKGDAKTPQYASLLGEASARYRARNGGPVWAYTHAWRDVPRSAWGPAVSVLASLESDAQVHEARAQGYAPAVVIEAKVFEERTREGINNWKGESGITWLACPAQTNEYNEESGTGRQCYNKNPKNACTLCFRADRLFENGYGICFSAHGAVEQIADAITNVKSHEQHGSTANMAGGEIVSGDEVIQPVDPGELAWLYEGGDFHPGGF